MKIPYSLIMLFTSCFGPNKDVKSKPENLNVNSTTSFYQYKAVDIDGDTIDFSKYKGKKVLIVNTASECGYTPQYAELQKLHEQYGDKVTILGFPCNQFGKQEPGNEKEIKEFCKQNYGVTFQMFSKVDVKGENQHPIFEWLTNKEKNGWNTQEPGWNFCKYLINEKGELMQFYGAAVSPMNKKIIEAISK